MAARDREVVTITMKMATRRRWNPDADLTDLRRELAVARFEEKIRDAVDSAPDLPADVSERLVELIRAVGVRSEAMAS